MSSTNKRSRPDPIGLRDADHYESTPHMAAAKHHQQQHPTFEKVRLSAVTLDVPNGPVFFPSVDEFVQGPVAYVEKIRPIAERYGACKVIPPPGWDPECCKFRDAYTLPGNSMLTSSALSL
jgi:jmjN domain